MKCSYCELNCTITEGSTGVCHCYTNTSEAIVERFPGTYLVEYPISIETVPLLHFYPQGKFLQVSTIGCNFSCPGCVSEILTGMVDELWPAMKRRSPDEVVAHALAEHCIGIVFCLNEPAVAYPTFQALAKAAHEQGLLVGCSTNGYFTANALAGLLPFLDCVTVGVKGCSDAAYHSCGVPFAAPVFSTIRTLVTHHIHVEVTLVHVLGHEQDIMETAEKIAIISPDIPVQVMRFVAFGLADLRLEPSIRESENLCDALMKKFPFVYLFNSPGSEYLDSRCPICGSSIVSREMFGPMGAHVIASRQNAICRCGYHLPITGTVASYPFAEPGMMGGYRPTRALETIDAYLVCLGVTEKEARIRVWLDFMQRNYINELHTKIQTVEGSYGIISHLAQLTGHESRGEELIQYMKARVADIATRIDGAAKPRVYYMMGLPRFALNEERFEMRLVELAGGEITNRNLPRQGKPGITISDDDLRCMNPDVMIISGLFSTTVEDVCAYCDEHGIAVPAMRNNQVHAMHPSWDFGNPRWILGLMVLANILHPDRCSFDIPAEADTFYRKFYGMPFADTCTNRSFFRPSI